jgi:hypothetical protein
MAQLSETPAVTKIEVATEKAQLLKTLENLSVEALKILARKAQRTPAQLAALEKKLKQFDALI